MTANGLAPTTTVQFVPNLTVRAEPDGGICLGDPETGAFLVEQLRAGRSLMQAAEHFADRFGERPDIDPFVRGLAELGLVVSIGVDPQAAPPMRARGVRLLGG